MKNPFLVILSLVIGLTSFSSTAQADNYTIQPERVISVVTADWNFETSASAVALANWSASLVKECD
ncbi:hypothetical protein V2H45_20280 [Tumidithrix elongata RA019]|uniref:Uncharacterized protein n=1 Tax=Tumidithrix elongata BACA0141 TaxID=2716417 RepID=A0AAW9Q827_9CYAN|nr:hypothetical protein [Tumidithrix elongata RA019]